MKIVSLHGDGRAHRTWSHAESVLGEPWVVSIAAGTVVIEASGEIWSSPYPVIAFFSPSKFYQVFMMLKQSGTDFYCNIISPVVYDSAQSVITFVDLDLDVVVRDDVVEIADKEEFEERCSTYPYEWVDGAKQGLTEVHQLALSKQGPFSPATVAKWRAWSSTLTRCEL